MVDWLLLVLGVLSLLAIHSLVALPVGNVLMRCHGMGFYRAYWWATFWPLAILWFGLETLDKEIKSLAAEQRHEGEDAVHLSSPR